ncbi:MAG TPA: hypothetical protein VEY92_09830 [Pseudoxanthomonas sp.]|nr:hypothetical protein [Pseudoxanthomonas sp.]
MNRLAKEKGNQQPVRHRMPEQSRPPSQNTSLAAIPGVILFRIMGGGGPGTESGAEGGRTLNWTTVKGVDDSFLN